MDDAFPGNGVARNWLEPSDIAAPEDFRRAIGGHPLVADLLYRRGLRDPAAALAFLDPARYHPAAPEELPGVEPACALIEQTIRRKGRICVWGDFDVDGQTATTLLVSALRMLGAEVTYHIPVRAVESHGVSVRHLAPIIDQGIDLLLTCDTGIAAHEAIDYARGRGTEVIVTDHHALPERLPETGATVSSRLLPADHPLAGLPGVGVAYKLVEALYARAPRMAGGRGAVSDAFLDLVALGIVADLATLSGDTRYLLQRGLAVIRTAPRTGLQVMMEIAGLQPGWITEEHIGFVLGPRLNALGRLDDANPVVEFLTTADAARARVLATHLEGLNAHRRLLTGQVLEAALAQIEKDRSLLDLPALVLSHPEWPAGVIGIVASELAERFNRPTILIAAPPGAPARGSARSVEGINITDAIAAQKHLLLSYGGHPMAAGLSLESGQIHAFRNALARTLAKEHPGPLPRPSLEISGYLSLTDLSLDLIADLERLAPFGSGNPSLVMGIRNLKAASVTPIGREGDHLQVMVEDEQGNNRRVIWWRGAGWPFPEGHFDLACVLRASNYRGARDVQVEWLDARPVESGSISMRTPQVAVIDQRGLPHPLPVLKQIVETGDVVIWGEAEAARLLDGAGDRTRLHPASTLIIWTTPPGRAELALAMEQVAPRSVVLFGVDPADSTADAFLKQLAGMAKYAVEQKMGPVAVRRLAAAAGQREATIVKGLQWLEARGMVRVTFLAEEGVLIQAGADPGQPQKAKQLLRSITALVDETAAYRRYFQTAGPEFLIG